MALHEILEGYNGSSQSSQLKKASVGRKQRTERHSSPVLGRKSVCFHKVFVVGGVVKPLVHKNKSAKNEWWINVKYPHIYHSFILNYFNTLKQNNPVSSSKRSKRWNQEKDNISHMTTKKFNSSTEWLISFSPEYVRKIF